MKRELPRYPANAYHPNLGTETAAGTVIFTQFKLQFESDLATFDVEYHDIRLRLGEGEDERLYFDLLNDPEWSLYTGDFDILNDRIFTTNNHLRTQVSTLFGKRAHRKALIISVAVIVIFAIVALSASWAMGKMVRHIVNKVPPDTEQKLSDYVFKEVQKRETFIQDPRLMTRLNVAFTQLRNGLPDTNITVQFHLIDREIPNAMVIPGHVFVTRGLFDLLYTPEELAGVLAHEFAHIYEKHALRGLVQDEGPAFILSNIFGKKSGAMGSLVVGSQFVVGRSFSKEFEREADDAGWKYLVAANINPHGLIDALTKLKEVEDRHGGAPPTILSTHPATERRIDKLEANWRKLEKKTAFFEFPER